MKPYFDSEAFDADILYQANYSERPPRVSACMITYGHEKYIVKAVSTILEQTYRDFELIISDDASPDDTKNVLLDYLKAYHGDAQVVYIRHRKNSRSGGRGHVFLFDRMVRGDIQLSMDGDDFSVPDRLQRTVELWDSLSPEPSVMIVNAYRYLDEEDRVDGYAQSNDVCSIGERRFYPPGDPIRTSVLAFGSGTVLSRRFCEWCRQFKPVSASIIALDVVRTRRALLDRGVWFVNEPLFYYRVNAGSVSGSGIAGKNWIHDRLARFLQLEQDMRQVAPNHQLTAQQERDIKYWIKRTKYSESLIDCPTWKWPWLWLRFLFYSPDGARGALRCRLKFLICGDVNAPFRKMMERRFLCKV